MASDMQQHNCYEVHEGEKERESMSLDRARGDVRGGKAVKPDLIRASVHGFYGNYRYDEDLSSRRCLLSCGDYARKKLTLAARDVIEARINVATSCRRNVKSNPLPLSLPPLVKIIA